MSYEVFTLKYRPQSFDDVVGQEAVAATLKRAVETNRVANAYLLCGSRGVGKTSMARILSKALNCPQVSAGDPCNQCEVCESIAKGENLDVIEIDGASNRGIDDIRGIREGAGYVPSQGNYKIYIIDEVHMLTIQAFNALLKVLEEPPAHVKFVFATTDPNNLPDTILSRCQRHEFRRISEDDIIARLQHICQKESVVCDASVLEAIARKAEGGLRDSISLLDQVVSYAGETIELADLERAIGVLPTEHLEGLARTMANQDLPGVLESIKGAFWSGYDPQELMAALTSWFRDYMVWHADPDGRSQGRQEALFAELAELMPLDRVLYLTKLFLNLRGDIKRSGHERIQLELTCIKAAKSLGMLPVDEIMARLKGKVAPPPPAVRSTSVPNPVPATPRPSVSAPKVQEPSPESGPQASMPRAAEPQTTQSTPKPPAREAQAANPAQEPKRPEPPSSPQGGAKDHGAAVATGVRSFVTETGAQTALEQEPTPPPPRPALTKPVGPPHLTTLRQHWVKIIDLVKDMSSMVGSSLDQAAPQAIDGNQLVLNVPKSNAFLCEQLSRNEALGMITKGIEAQCGWTLKIAVVQVDSGADGAPVMKKSVYDDPTVRRFIEHFDGGIMNVEKSDG